MAASTLLHDRIPLGCDVADTSARRVEEEVEVLWIVGIHECGLKGGEIREEDPIPRSHQHVFRFDVSMTNLVKRGRGDRDECTGGWNDMKLKHSILKRISFP